MDHPRYTPGQVRKMLAERFGTARGHPDWDAAAEFFGVTPRSVRRWTEGPTRGRAHIPNRRLDQLRLPLLEQDREDAQAKQDRKSAQALARGMARSAWWQQRWIEDHQVAVVVLDEQRRRRVRQVRFARVSSKKGMREIANAGLRQEQVASMPSLFHARLLVHRVLKATEGWREVRTGVDQAGTQCWWATGSTPRLDKPRVDLAALADEVIAEVGRPDLAKLEKKRPKS